jgi:hypothetical protein
LEGIAAGLRYGAEMFRAVMLLALLQFLFLVGIRMIRKEQ